MNVLFVMCKTWKTNKPLPYLVLLSTFNIFVLFAERKVCKVIYGNKGVYRCISVLMYCMCLMSTVCIYAYVWVCVFHMLIHSIIPKSKMYFAPKKKSAKACRTMCVLLFFSVQSCIVPWPQLTSMFFISQRNLGRDQTSPCRAWRSVSSQPGEGQHQPNPSGRASSAQVNKDCTIDQTDKELGSLICSTNMDNCLFFCLNSNLMSHTYQNYVQT